MEAPPLRRLLLFFVIIGLLVSLYATAEVADSSLQSTCSVNAYVCCSCVDRSAYTTIGPIPDWSIGVSGFVLLLIFGVLLLRTEEPRYLDLIVLFSLVGLSFSVYFAYLEVVKIGAVCPVCFSAYIANLGVLLTSVALVRMRSKAIEEEEIPEKPRAASKKRARKGR